MPFLEVAKPRPHVTQVTLNRPERMNAMSFDVMLPFRRALEEISHDNDTRVVVVTGAINVPAIGGGLCLSLAFDIRVAADSAYFRAAGINNGLSSAELGLSYL